jgi:hypothetical protein
MKKSIRILLLFVFTVVTINLITGCYKDKTVVFDTGNEITRPVSFATDIAPIFNSSCSLSGCHGTGGKTPNLSNGNAFSSLISGNFVDVNDPTSSLIYLWMTGKKSTPMPIGGINKEYNALILAWIKQGAQNN